MTRPLATFSRSITRLVLVQETNIGTQTSLFLLLSLLRPHCQRTRSQFTNPRSQPKLRKLSTMKLPSASSSSSGSSKGSFAFALSNLLADKMARSLPSTSGLSFNTASRLQARLSNLAGTWSASRIDVAADYDKDWLITRCSSSQMARLDREGGCFWFVPLSLDCSSASVHANPCSLVDGHTAVHLPIQNRLCAMDLMRETIDGQFA